MFIAYSHSLQVREPNRFMSNVSIRVDNLSKRYRIGKTQERHDTLRDALMASARAPLHWLSRNGKGAGEDEWFWALKDVSFEIQRGEVVGVIGRNGAGKSTLLKILSRITEPTEGHAEIHGRVGTLLEVGTGFHQELTGRENIYLSGAILGMKRAEIERKFDEIVAFAEIEKFIDTPVKRYSSGMYVRLAFAVAAHLEPEILLVDEVLAVGDAAFQKKCLGKMGDVAKEGRTVLFVSHNMGAVRNLCERAILLDQGEISVDKPAELAIDAYLTTNAVYDGVWKREVPIPNTAGIYFEEVSITNSKDNVTGSIDSTEFFAINLVVQVPRDISRSQIAIRLINQEGIPIFTTANSDMSKELVIMREGRYRYKVQIPGSFLAPGIYGMIVASMIPGIQGFDIVENGATFRVEDVGSHATALHDGRLGLVTPLFVWEQIAYEHAVA